MMSLDFYLKFTLWQTRPQNTYFKKNYPILFEISKISWDDILMINDELNASYKIFYYSFTNLNKYIEKKSDNIDEINNISKYISLMLKLFNEKKDEFMDYDQVQGMQSLALVVLSELYSEYFSESLKLQIDQRLDHLYKLLSNEKEIASNNHGTMQIYGLLSICEKYNYNTDFAIEQLDKNILTMFSEYGNIHTENSSAYASLFTPCVINIFECFELGRNNIFEVVEKSSRLVNAISQKFSYGDSPYLVESKVRGNDIENNVRTGLILSQKGDYDLLCICGYYKDSHKHCDDNSIQVNYKGKKILVDPGYNGYMYANKDEYQLYSSKMHNCTYIDNENTFLYTNNFEKPKILFYENNGEYEYIVMENNSFYNASVLRHVILTEDGILIYDECYSEKAYTFVNNFISLHNTCENNSSIVNYDDVCIYGENYEYDGIYKGTNANFDRNISRKFGKKINFTNIISHKKCDYNISEDKFYFSNINIPKYIKHDYIENRVEATEFQKVKIMRNNEILQIGRSGIIDIPVEANKIEKITNIDNEILKEEFNRIGEKFYKKNTFANIRFNCEILNEKGNIYLQIKSNISDEYKIYISARNNQFEPLNIAPLISPITEVTKKILICENVHENLAINIQIFKNDLKICSNFYCVEYREAEVEKNYRIDFWDEKLCYSLVKPTFIGSKVEFLGLDNTTLKLFNFFDNKLIECKKINSNTFEIESNVEVILLEIMYPTKRNLVQYTFTEKNVLIKENVLIEYEYMEKNSDVLLVNFNAVNSNAYDIAEAISKRDISKSLEFTRSASAISNFGKLDEMGFDIISFSDNLNFRSTYYVNSSKYWHYINKIIESISHKYKKVISIGSSKGGFGALYCAQNVKYIDHAIAIIPQTNLWSRGVEFYKMCIDFKYSSAYINRDLIRGNISILTGEKDWYFKEQNALIRENDELITFQGEGHSAIIMDNYDEIFANVKKIIDEKVDASTIFEEDDVNIVGSCISRDIFRITPKDVNIYVARTSFASQFLFTSPDINIAVDTKLSPFQKKIVEYENTKILKLEIKKLKGIIVIDLFDELLQQYVYGDKMVCMSSYVSDKSVEIPNFDSYHTLNNEEKFELFKKGFDYFMNEANLNSKIKKIFIIRINDCTKYSDESTVNSYIGNKLDSYYDYISQNYSHNVEIINPNDEFLVGNATHIWGKAPYHFIDEFYIYCYNQIFKEQRN